ncbi:MAG: ECF transporter S component, partial [Clostridia bacterium]|nr:ECF transporter S component [Clostridia bacterium]
MNQTKVNKIVISAVFAALICVMTMFFPIKLPNGYANLGDCFIILAGCAVGPIWGAGAAAIGASLADLLLGYGLYAPATFVIKALMGIAVGLIFSKLRNKNLFAAALVSAVCAEIIM